MRLRLPLLLLASLLLNLPAAAQSPSIPAETHLLILRAEDERRFDDSLAALLKHSSPAVRARAALAAGRIGDPRAVPALLPLLQSDPDPAIRARAAFALGEIEPDAASPALLEILRPTALDSPDVCRDSCWLIRARAVEALGKIAAALPASQSARKSELADAILSVLSYAHKFSTYSNISPSPPQRELPTGPMVMTLPETRTISLIRFAITAALRARPAGAPDVIALFLSSADPSIRADAANAISRLYPVPDTSGQRPTPSAATLESLGTLLTKDRDPIVRANAARALGAATTSASTYSAPLLVAATTDADSRVRVSAIRALAQICPLVSGKSACAASPAPQLLTRAQALFTAYAVARGKGITRPDEISELLEIATALGTLLTATNDAPALKFLREFRLDVYITPEVEIALARISPSTYLANAPRTGAPDPARERTRPAHWRAAIAFSQGLRELARPEVSGADEAAARLHLAALKQLKDLLRARWPNIAVPAFLRAYAAFKPDDLDEVLSAHLNKNDMYITAAAADLVATRPPSPSTQAILFDILRDVLKDREPDAALSILTALAAQKSEDAYRFIEMIAKEGQRPLLTERKSQPPNYLVRRRAAALLKDAGRGDFSSQIGFVIPRYTTDDYRRALSRLGTKPRAVVTTEKGAFTIELLPDDAPITVDNFIQLANAKFFDGFTVHRVVPNFVMQDGDPRGDGEGGPGWQIRCEINEVPYHRGAVGMALSGKDTGGSQWFVTHSPQPHLDGGYTVFGRVIAGMDVVDRISRLDRILSIRISP